jgi:hypothetical protein
MQEIEVLLIIVEELKTMLGDIGPLAGTLRREGIEVQEGGKSKITPSQKGVTSFVRSRIPNPA